MLAGPLQNNDLAGHVPVPAGFTLLYADDCLLVLDKPAGLLSVPGKGGDKQDCLSARVQRDYPEALVVHRLDMATSGLVLMARSRAVQRTLSQAFAERAVHKTYEAVVHGHAAGLLQGSDAWNVIDLPVAVDWPRRPLRIIDAALGKASVTRWQVRSHGLDNTRLALEPVTGRSHQLRVHLQALGHPILGDRLYAPEAVQACAPRLLLHACTLRLAHPVSGEALRFESAVPF